MNKAAMFDCFTAELASILVERDPHENITRSAHCACTIDRMFTPLNEISHQNILFDETCSVAIKFGLDETIDHQIV